MRINEHEDSVKNDKDCVINDHCKNLDHNFHFNNVKILRQETKYTKRKHLETCEIISQENGVNKRTDSNKINIRYHTVIKKASTLS